MTTITRRKWTDREIEFVYENYGLLSQKEMADRLGRPAGSVHGLIKRLKIPKIPTQREFAVYQGDKFMFIGTMDYARSEERRVGKECRYRRWAEHYVIIV